MSELWRRMRERGLRQLFAAALSDSSAAFGPAEAFLGRHADLRHRPSRRPAQDDSSGQPATTKRRAGSADRSSGSQGLIATSEVPITTAISNSPGPCRASFFDNRTARPPDQRTHFAIGIPQQAAILRRTGLQVRVDRTIIILWLCCWSDLARPLRFGGSSVPCER